MGKLVEGLWDCPFCDNKRIRAGQKTCPNCGHPQDENTKFYMPDAIEYVSEEKAAKISRNPDWQCSFCGSLNSDNLPGNFFCRRHQTFARKQKPGIKDAGQYNITIFTTKTHRHHQSYQPDS